jgi:hypothetical protein
MRGNLGLNIDKMGLKQIFCFMAFTKVVRLPVGQHHTASFRSRVVMGDVRRVFVVDVQT